jgi:uncharacterized membrane protein
MQAWRLPSRTQLKNPAICSVRPPEVARLKNQPKFFVNFANSRRNRDLVMRNSKWFEEFTSGAWIALMKLKDRMQRSNAMIDRMLVVVFDDESKAYQGKKALLALENEGSISVYASAVIAKNADGTIAVRQIDDAPPLGTIFGTPLGSVIGLLGGPAGFAVGTAVGFLAGLTADLRNARIGEDFIDDVKKDLLPNKWAIIAEIEEDWTTPVDTRMEAIGGTVFRRALSDVADTVDEEEVAAMKADIAQMKEEHAKARADRRAKLQEKINQLESKIQARLEKAKERRQAAEQRARAKVEILKTKVAALKAKVAQAGDVVPD